MPSVCAQPRVLLRGRVSPPCSSFPADHASLIAAGVDPEQPSERCILPSRRPDARTAARSGHRAAMVGGMAWAVMCIAAVTADVRAQGTPSADRETTLATNDDRYGTFIAEAAERFGLPAPWIRRVMQAESAGVPSATSPAGAMGLMQVMPDTYAAMRTRHGLGNNPYDPRDNILAGAAVMREQFGRYGAPGFLAAYNAGPARYEQYLKEGRPLPAETVALVTALTPMIGGTLPESETTAFIGALPSPEEAPIFVVRSASSTTANPPPGSDPPEAEIPTLFAARRPNDRKPASVRADDSRSAESSGSGAPDSARPNAAPPDARLFAPTVRQREWR